MVGCLGIQVLFRVVTLLTVQQSLMTSGVQQIDLEYSDCKTKTYRYLVDEKLQLT